MAVMVHAEESLQPYKPNIILLMTDDQGWGEIGYNGHPFIKTPHLDDMAALAYALIDVFSVGGVFANRASVMTGRNPFRSGAHSINGMMRPSEVTLAQLLQDQGYETMFYGKWHLGGGKVSRTQQEMDHMNGGFANAIYTVNNSDHVDSKFLSKMVKTSRARRRN